MWINQKIQFFSAAAASIGVLIDLCLFVYYFLLGGPITTDVNAAALLLSGVWLCSLVALVGAYFGTEARKIAFLGVLFGSLTVFGVLGFWGCFLLLWWDELALLVILPAFFSLLTLSTLIGQRWPRALAERY